MIDSPVASIHATIGPSIGQSQIDRSQIDRSQIDSVTLGGPLDAKSSDAGRVAASRVGVDADDYWAQRVVQCLAHWSRTTSSDLIPINGLRVVNSPTPHCGLGSGTQMACSVATLLAAATKLNSGAIDDQGSAMSSDSPSSYAGGTNIPGADASVNFKTSRSQVSSVWLDRNSANREDHFEMGRAVQSLSSHSGRGKRSYVGLTGFLTGGLIVDRGHLGEGTQWGSRTHVMQFPESWPILLIRADEYVGESGGTEAAMFDRCASKPNPRRLAMLELIDKQIVPSLVANDWGLFSSSIRSYGEMAGEIFREVQGGIYRSDEIARIIETIQSMGLSGAGQSSWGPTVFAIARDDDQAKWVADKLREKLRSTDAVSITRAVNQGASLAFCDA